MIGGIPRNSFVLVEFEEGGGVFEVATLALGAVGLDVAERVQAFLELAGEAVAVHSESGEGTVGVAGWYSSKKPRRWASNAAWSPVGRTAEAAVKPWRSALSEERCLPDSVRGPVESFAFARLVAARWASEGFAPLRASHRSTGSVVVGVA